MLPTVRIASVMVGGILEWSKSARYWWSNAFLHTLDFWWDRLFFT